MIDGSPIIAIATVKSGNSKTGDMVQTWIMADGIEPHKAIESGDDKSVCGDCTHRPANDGSCYVLTFQAPLSVYRAYKRGSYAGRTMEQFRDKPLRMGSYGDPLAVPLEVEGSPDDPEGGGGWRELIEITKGRTGYTHQWANPDFSPIWKELVMASVDNPAEAEAATKEGWRYFRVTNADAPKAKGEAVCPASKEAGKKLNCTSCLSCSGQSGQRASIVINAHGSRAKNYRLIEHRST